MSFEAVIFDIGNVLVNGSLRTIMIGSMGSNAASALFAKSISML